MSEAQCHASKQEGSSPNVNQSFVLNANAAPFQPVARAAAEGGSQVASLHDKTKTPKNTRSKPKRCSQQKGAFAEASEKVNRKDSSGQIKKENKSNTRKGTKEIALLSQQVKSKNNDKESEDVAAPRSRNRRAHKGARPRPPPTQTASLHSHYNAPLLSNTAKNQTSGKISSFPPSASSSGSGSVEDFPSLSLSSLSSASRKGGERNIPSAHNFLAAVHSSIRLECEAAAEEAFKARQFASSGGALAQHQGWFTSTGEMYKQQQQQQREGRCDATVSKSDSESSLSLSKSDVSVKDVNIAHSYHSIGNDNNCPSPSDVTTLLFQYTISDKIREKYRTRWLDIAHEATLRAQNQQARGAETSSASARLKEEQGGGGGVSEQGGSRETVKIKVKGKVKGSGSSVKRAVWHAALCPAVEVSNALLNDRYVDEESDEDKFLAHRLSSQTQIQSAGTCEKSMMRNCEEIAHTLDKRESVLEVRTLDTDMSNTWWRGVCIGDVQTLRGMMERGFQWSNLTFGEDNFYSLHLAAIHAHSSVLELLLSASSTFSHCSAAQARGNDVDCVDGKKRTPLLVACEVGDLACVETLLVHRASLGVRDKAADGPLHKVARGGSHGQTYAAYQNFNDNFSVKLSSTSSEQGLRAIKEDKHGSSNRHATNKGQLAVLKYLLRKHSSSQNLRLNGRNRQGDTPLSLLCGRCSRDSGHYHSMAVLLTHAGADPLIVNAAGVDSLCLVAQCGAANIAQHLLFCNNKSNHNNNTNRVSSKAATHRKYNPLIEAIRCGHDTCARVLIRSCAQETSEGNDDTQITHHTMIHEKGTFHWHKTSTAPAVPLDRPISSLITPLMAAVIMNNTALVSLLLSTGYSFDMKHPRFSVHTVDNRGFSALVYATLFASPACLRMVLNYCYRSCCDPEAREGKLLIGEGGGNTTESVLETAALARAFFFPKQRDREADSDTFSCVIDGKCGREIKLALESECGGMSRLPSHEHQRSLLLHSFPYLIRSGCALMTHKLLRRIVSNEKYGHILNETKHLDPGSVVNRGSGPDSSSGPLSIASIAADREGARVSPGSSSRPLSSILTDPVVQWHHEAMPYPDLMLVVSLYGSVSGQGSSSSQEQGSEKLIPCHSFILMQHSSCFKTMLTTHRHMLRVYPSEASDGGGGGGGGHDVSRGDIRRIEIFAASIRSVELLLCWMYQGTDTCENLQELVDLLLLANEFLVTRLQLICEHRIGKMFSECTPIDTCTDMCSEAEMDVDSEGYAALTVQLLELGKALNLTTLLSYVPTWSGAAAATAASICFNSGDGDGKVTRGAITHPAQILREKQQLGYMDNKNADFPFLILLLLARVRQQEKHERVKQEQEREENTSEMGQAGRKSSPAVRYLECFLALVTDNEDNYYARTYDVLDILVEAFPVVLVDEDEDLEKKEVVNSYEENEGVGLIRDEEVKAELECFHLHNKLQRIYILQSLLAIYFTSLQELVTYMLNVTDSDTNAEGGGEIDGDRGFADRLSHKMYWFCKRHILLRDISVTVEVDVTKGRIHKMMKGNSQGDLLLLLDPAPEVLGVTEEEVSRGICSTSTDEEGDAGASSLWASQDAFCVHRAVVAGGSSRLQALLRLKAATQVCTDRNTEYDMNLVEAAAHSSCETIQCTDVEPVCLHSLLLLLYCNYLPPVSSLQAEKEHLRKFRAAASTVAAPVSSLWITLDSEEGGRSSSRDSGSLCMSYYMHLAAFADEYCVHPRMMQAAETQLRALLTTSTTALMRGGSDYMHYRDVHRASCEPAGQLFLLARSLRLPHLAGTAAVHFLYGYAALMQEVVAHKGGEDGNCTAAGGDWEESRSSTGYSDLIRVILSTSEDCKDSDSDNGSSSDSLVSKLDCFCREVLMFLAE